MARPSSLWFRESNGFWYVTIRGTQHKLSQDKTAARKMMNKLLAGQDDAGGARAEKEKSSSSSSFGLTVRKLCDNYLVKTKDRKEEETHDWHVSSLSAFCEGELGRREASSLKVHQVESWLDRQTTWGKSTKALFICTVKAVFNFGEEQGYFALSPIKKLKRMRTQKRERVLTLEERTRIKAAASQGMRDFLELLESTGCRPFSEGAKLTAADVDFEKGRSFRKQHKTAKKGKSRTLYFPPATLARLKELAAVRPTGPLFRGQRDNAWTRRSVGMYLTRVGKKLGIAGVTAYSWRHSFISGALSKGMSVDVVAELVGNSPAVIRSTYSHLEAMDEAMRAAAEKAVGG